MTGKKILTINGWFLVAIGFSQAANGLLGHFGGIGLFKILDHLPIGTIGIFEAHFLAGVMGIIFIRAAKKQSGLKFWNLTACGIHLVLGTSNLIFWADTFVILHAEIPGLVATIIHFCFAFSEGLIGFKKINE